MPSVNQLRVCSFESRRREDMAALIRRHGGEPTLVPSMREVPLEENSDALAFGRELSSGRIDAVVFLTGVGTDALLDLLRSRHTWEDLVAALNRCTVVVRGPKPTAVLRRRGIPIDLRAPEPNTWREVIAVLQGRGPLAGKTIAVQEYGQPGQELYAALRKRGAVVRPVPIYRWALPADTEPLKQAVRDAIDGAFDVLLFTSAQQVRNVVQVADEAGCRSAWRTALRNAVVGSIGPTTSEALQAAGLTADVEASPTKMGSLARQTLLVATEILERKSREPG
ncbi:MAG: uroporphyrinogen-III synthase [Planctomycetaceae bacterium]